jgi:hypothetical protein
VKFETAAPFFIDRRFNQTDVTLQFEARRDVMTADGGFQQKEIPSIKKDRRQSRRFCDIEIQRCRIGICVHTFTDTYYGSLQYV